MPFWHLDATARAAWAAATTQQAQLEGLRDEWAGQMSVRYYSAADAHLATVTHATPIIDTTTTPYSLRLGAWVAESHVQDGTAAYCILAVPAGADILRADVSLAGAISDPGGRVRLDIGATLRIYATAGLPTEAASGAANMPAFQNVAEFDNGSGFDTSLAGTFDVGAGPSTGIVARVISHTGSGGGDVTSFVIGGVTLTALAQTAITGFNANERVFYGVGLSLTGSQSWTATVGSATRIAVQLFAAHSVVSFDAGVAVTLINNTLAQAVTPDSNSIHVGLLTSNLDAGVVTAKSGTIDRLNAACNFYQSLIFTEEGPSDPSMHALVTGSAFTSSYLGRIVRLQGTVPTAPSWVPAAGEVAVLSVANGLLSNSFISQCAPYYSAFYFPRVANCFGGCVKNPYYGDYGCAWFQAGGHGNTNDNTVVIAEYGASEVTFKRAFDPTPWFGTGTDGTTQSDNSVNGIGAQGFLDWLGTPGSSFFNYGINSIDGAPGAHHPYGLGDFLGPEEATAGRHGTFLRVWTPAINQANTLGAISALALDFASTTEASSARTWRKHSLERRDQSTGEGSAPIMSAKVPAQKRIYFVSNGTTEVRWYDYRTGTYVDGSGTGFDYDNADGFYGGNMFYVPARGLLICAFRQSGNIKIQWMDVTVDQPTLGGTVVLSETPLAVLDPWGAACWCPDNNRIILGAISGDNTSVREVEIPSTLTDTWTVTRAAFGASQTLPNMDSTGEFQRWRYDERIKSIFYFQYASATGEDVAYCYKPRNT